MKTSPKLVQQRFNRLLSAWSNLRPGKSFGGLTLAEFTTAVQVSLAARQRVEELQNQLIAARELREEVDGRHNEFFQRVVSGIKADPEEGPNGELYATIGYVRPDKRRTGATRTRKLKETATTASAKAA